MARLRRCVPVSQGNALNRPQRLAQALLGRSNRYRLLSAIPFVVGRVRRSGNVQPLSSGLDAPSHPEAHWSQSHRQLCSEISWRLSGDRDNDEADLGDA